MDRIKAFIKSANQYDSKAKAIPVIPDYLSKTYMLQSFGLETNEQYLVVGLDYASVTPVVMNYMQQDVLALSGENKKNKDRTKNQNLKSKMKKKW